MDQLQMGFQTLELGCRKGGEKSVLVGLMWGRA
jgi:hypothetical protein